MTEQEEAILALNEADSRHGTIIADARENGATTRDLDALYKAWHREADRLLYHAYGSLRVSNPLAFDTAHF